ncbi:CbtB domain-containing protein [Rhizobium jaguaris]|uniref:CbtB-domain containing protein n=1 Tax=Rhizobium jaguaris TaxID=1312183 RepID=A0A387FTW2_9HYPH|nr:CbtB-domain containing protein [Rhizobium jaguaris]AYG62109.1 CbtB-domain containing protein [Rhizobium jaguaris]
MTDIVVHPAPSPSPISCQELLPWAAFVGLLLLMTLYFVGAEQGATLLMQGDVVHEFIDDGRHLLGFPCH